MRLILAIAALALLSGPLEARPQRGGPDVGGSRADVLNAAFTPRAGAGLASLFAQCRRQVRQEFRVNNRGKGGKVAAIRQWQIDACVRSAAR